jgi:3-methyladenine DNA glycosylase AlkD
MTIDEAMAALEQAGTAQNRKVYARHGVGEKMFGVSYAVLGKLKKAIKTDHQLAKGLWSTGNHDAQVLATMVADPQAMTSKQIDDWIKGVDDPPLAGAFAGVVAKTRFAARKATRWCQSRNELIGCTGWTTVSFLTTEYDPKDDDYFRPFLETIENDIHGCQNRVREAMNRTLIAIGCRSPALRKEAERVAKAVGKVDIDHGETGCRTPDAAAYIKKTWDQRKVKARKSVRKKNC